MKTGGMFSWPLYFEKLYFLSLLFCDWSSWCQVISLPAWLYPALTISTPPPLHPHVTPKIGKRQMGTPPPPNKTPDRYENLPIQINIAYCISTSLCWPNCTNGDPLVIYSLQPPPHQMNCVYCRRPYFHGYQLYWRFVLQLVPGHKLTCMVYRNQNPKTYASAEHESNHITTVKIDHCHDDTRKYNCSKDK